MRDYNTLIPRKSRRGFKRPLQLCNEHRKTKKNLTKLNDLISPNSSCGWDVLSIRFDSPTSALLHSSSNMFPPCGGKQRGAEKPLMIVTGLELMVKPIDAE